MKKILIYTYSFFPLIGGIGEIIKNLGEEYKKKGYEVDILACKIEKDWKNQEEMFGFHVYRYTNFFDQLKFFIKNRNKYEIILSRGFSGHSVYLGLFKFLHITKTTTIICSDTGGDNGEIVVIKNHYKKFGLYKLYYYFIGRNDYINCLNNENIRDFKEIYTNKAQYMSKITKIYNGCDVTNFTPKKRVKNIENILFLSRLVEEKGIFIVIEAFKKIQNDTLILHIVGNGDKIIESKVLEAIKTDTRIIFHGKLYGEEKENILKNMDLFVFPSFASYEGQPMVIGEMAVKNIPIISTDVGNIKEIFGDNILYTAKNNSTDLKNKIEWIVGNIGAFEYEYSEIIPKLDIKKIAIQFLDLKK